MQTDQSFWEDVLYQPKYDLIVIGAGITGQSTAFFYKKNNPDAKVLIVERGFFPIGSTTRNAGFACIGSVGELIADLEVDSEESLKKRIQSRYKGLLLLRETLGDENLDYEHCGGWEIFADEKEFDKAKSVIPKFNAWMEELIGEKEVYTAGTFEQKSAIHNRVEGMLHSGKLVKTLSEKNVKAGVEFRWNCEVEDVDAEKSSLTLKNGVVFEAEKLVLATNAFSSKFVTSKPIKPGRGYIFVTNELKDLKWKGNFHYDKGYVYFRSLGDNRMLIGGGRNADMETETTAEFGINEHIKSYLTDLANNLLNLEEGWEIEREWSGIMGFSETKAPYCEAISENTFLVAGLSGMGVALGMQLGKTAAEMIEN